MVTSVTWWLPVVTFGYQRYQVLHDSMLCTRGLWLPQLPGGYLWLLCVTSVTRYCITLCCVRGVRLPQLPGGYLWLLCVTSVTRYCMTLCCVRGVQLLKLPGGYLWLLCVTSVTRYCMTLCCVREDYGYLRYLVVTCGYYVLPALPGIA